MFDLPEIATRETLVKAARRELGYREHVYPRRVASGKMTSEQQRKELAVMRQMVAVLETMTNDEFSVIMRRIYKL